ncbi:uncharacterized protein LOC122019532 [Zingiber officinale]|uniref:uncharacterized protein LOC122019532 n=1 Tax=Zingiber officinale TaxID=94328 RepID=UPI001C4BC08D|nr:uncharacterized protein LOC122019532 [Zingiber officinale]
MTTPLYGFTGNEVLPIEQTRLAILLGEDPLRRTRATNFIVVDAPSAYNVILGRSALNEFRAIVSTFCQKIKFSVEDQVGEVRGDRLAARRCYMEMVRSESRSTRKTPRIEVNTIIEKPPTLVCEEKEEVQIHPCRPEAATFIASDLEGEQRKELIKCLQQNHDVFAWSTHELPNISPSVAQHELHVRLDAQPVKQQKRDFNTEHNQIIRAEVEKLLEVGHIREKCLFGAKSGHFLGYIVTERGIEANPRKVKALQDMLPPRNLREAQRLIGRITALSRFISRSADRSLPFFKILRRATKFQWDEECDRAFEKLIAYLNSLPVLVKPIVGEPLKIYLSLADHAVSSTLVRTDGEEQPVYFLSHILKGAESRYTGLEKLAFALVLAARRLRSYFLAHTIIVMTNSPLSRVLLNPEALGWLIKWTTEFSEFDSQYQPRAAIKAQSLADFIIEVQDPEPKVAWKVYVDGSSNWQGTRVGILLISLREERMQLSVRLDYRATNNELAAQQLFGTFEVNSARLRLYAEAFEKLRANFQEVVIKKVPRVENQAADEMTKLASSISSIDIQLPIDQVSLVAHVDRMEGLSFPNDWRTALVEFLRTGATPSNRDKAQLLRRRASKFTLIGEQLYKKSFSRPLLKCVGPEDIDYIL